MELDSAKCFEVILNYKCNFNCLFCSQGHEYKESLNSDIGFDQAVKLMRNALKNGYGKIGFTGGEPLLNKDIFKIVSFAKKCGFKVVRVQTNGLLLSDKDFFARLALAGANFIKISVHSHKPDIHDKLVGVVGAFEKIDRAIDNVNEKKVRLGINMVINKYNYKELLEFAEYFFEKKMVREFVFIFPTHVANMDLNKDELSVSYSDLKPYLVKLLDYFKSKTFDDYLFLNIPPCIFPEAADKIINLSDYLTVVNSREGKWDLDENRSEMNVKPEKCKNCIHFKKCPGLDSNYYKKWGDSDLLPVL